MYYSFKITLSFFFFLINRANIIIVGIMFKIQITNMYSYSALGIDMNNNDYRVGT